jgi:hypothetical protein
MYSYGANSTIYKGSSTMYVMLPNIKRWKPLHLCNTSYHFITLSAFLRTHHSALYVYLPATCMVRNAKETSIPFYFANVCSTGGGGVLVYYFQE